MHEALPWASLLGGFLVAGLSLAFRYGKDMTSARELSRDVKDIKIDVKDLSGRVRTTELTVARIEAKVQSNGSQQ